MEAETPEHLNTVGQWLKDNVARNQAGLGNSDEDYRGIWCTNCHTQLSQELWRTEDCNDLIHGDCLVNPRAAGPNLSDVADAVGLTEHRRSTTWIRRTRWCSLQACLRSR